MRKARRYELVSDRGKYDLRAHRHTISSPRFSAEGSHRLWEYIEEKQFRIGWFAGGTKPEAAAHLRVAIDGTVLTGTEYEASSKIEVIAGRVERDGGMGRRIACALPFRPVLARMLVAAALEQSGWTRETMVDVITDGARGMRALLTAVAPSALRH